ERGRFRRPRSDRTDPWYNQKAVGRCADLGGEFCLQKILQHFAFSHAQRRAKIHEIHRTRVECYRMCGVLAERLLELFTTMRRKRRFTEQNEHGILHRKRARYRCGGPSGSKTLVLTQG